MKTEIETVGFGGGFTDARSNTAARRAVPLVQVRTRQGSYLGYETKDARPKRQLRTGVSNGSRQMTVDSLAHLPRWKRWCACALCSLTLSGILPMAAAGLLIELCDLVGWWLLIPLYIVIGRAVWRVMWS